MPSKNYTEINILNYTLTLIINLKESMKKFYALALGVVAALTANAAPTVTLAGGFNGWNSSSDVMAEKSAGIYELTVPSLLTGFKVVVTEDEVSTWYGTDEKVELGKPVTVSAPEGGPNMEFANDMKAVDNATVTFDLTNLTVTVTGQEAAIEVAYGIHGSFATGEWGTTNMEKNSEGLWVVTFEGLTGTAGEFGIKEMNAATGDQLSWIAAPVSGVTIEGETEEMELTKENTQNIAVVLTGDWTFIYNADEMLLSVVEAAGISDVAVEANGAAEYFNLQGVRVNEPAAGLYLVRKAGKVEKVLVK